MEKGAGGHDRGINNDQHCLHPTVRDQGLPGTGEGPK